MRRNRSRFDRLMLPALAAALASASTASAVSILETYTQNFDSMGSGTALPTGWLANNLGNVSFSATTLNGSSQGGTYKFTSGTDHAVGILNSGSFTTGKTISYTYTNNTGGTVEQLDLQWDYEKYRSGTRAWDWVFTASAGTVPTTGNQSYAADANNTTATFPPTEIAKGPFSITGLNLANSQAITLTWTLNGVGGSTNGQALAIDDFVLTAQGTPGGPPPPPPGPGVGPLFINEFDYDQPTSPSDNAEFIEIAGTPGVYENVSIQLINGANDTVYATFALPTFTLSDEADGYGFYVVAGDAANVPNTDLDVTPNVDLIQNGSPDAIALLINGVVVHYLSYEGNTTLLVNGTGVNDLVGPTENNNAPNLSLQKIGTGNSYDDFIWSAIAPTPGAVNTGQTFVAAAAAVPEPATLGFLGVAGLTLVARRRKQA